MALKFVNDAISLSGLTGSRLKCEVIGRYYPFWWNITSGGLRVNHRWPTAIVELDAATGEVFVEDTKETILGSSGHALELKCCNPNTRNLKVILVEKDGECYKCLERVIGRRWGNVDIGLAEGESPYNPTNIYLLNKELEEALTSVDSMKLGNALFFFDPLRSIEYQTIEKVANNRVKEYYQTGTEFIIFIFTSDWFLGRGDFVGLPTTANEAVWSLEETKTVLEADSLFGNQAWREYILNNESNGERENRLIEIYRNRLHKWFRYVLPMPFNPKRNQVFHLILCSNFETGVRATRKFYCGITGNTEYAPGNKSAFLEFRQHHPEIFHGISGNRRPIQWRMLWSTITQHEEGICDHLCSDYDNIEQDDSKKRKSLEWLESKGYLKSYDIDNAWEFSINQYKINWPTIKERLAIESPLPLKPLSLRPLSLKEISQ